MNQKTRGYFASNFPFLRPSGKSGRAAAAASLAPTNDCIFARSVGDYTPLDRSYLIPRGASRERACLATVTGASASLRTDRRIAFRTRDTRLRPRAGDTIPVGAPVPRELRIASIRGTGDRDVDTPTVRCGRCEADERRAPGPAGLPGAGAEELDGSIPNPL